MKTAALILTVFLFLDTATSQFMRQDNVLTPGRLVLVPVPSDGPELRMVMRTRPSSPFNPRFLKVPFLLDTYSSVMAARAFLVDKATTITQDLHWWLQLNNMKESDWMIGATLTHSPGRFLKFYWDQKNVEIWFDVAVSF
ncbi:hypothetical protein D4R51_03690 [bacterium]|nr:MAG: hypothetical protein D4R51_03690 [bacterium]